MDNKLLFLRHVKICLQKPGYKMELTKRNTMKKKKYFAGVFVPYFAKNSPFMLLVFTYYSSFAQMVI